MSSDPKGPETKPLGLCLSGDGHPGWSLFAWRPGVDGEPMCACCFRKMWQSTLENVTKGLAELPAECEAGNE